MYFLSKWDDGASFSIHAFNQGKYLLRERNGVEVLVEDPVKQGDARLDRFHAKETAMEGGALRIEEFAAMVDAARAGERVERPRQ